MLKKGLWIVALAGFAFADTGYNPPSVTVSDNSGGPSQGVQRVKFGQGLSVSVSGAVATVIGSTPLAPSDTNYIQNTAVPQAGATFYVTSGTISSNAGVQGSLGGILNLTASNSNYNEPLLYLQAPTTNFAASTIRIDGGIPAITLVDTTQTSPAGKFQLSDHNDTLRFESRNAAGTAFEPDFIVSRSTSPGRIFIGNTYTNAVSTVDILGNLSVGSYAGVNAAPDSGLIVSGNVGIGLPSPGKKLEIITTANDRADGLFIRPPDYGSTGSYLALNKNSGGGYALIQAGDNSSFQSLTLNPSGGKVGIGTTGPIATLDVNGAINIPNTTATTGFLEQNGTPFIHTYGSLNFFAGLNAGNLSLTGASNLAIGAGAAPLLTSGSNNMYLGSSAGNQNKDGNYNTGIGVDALASNVSDQFNTAIGYIALQNQNGGTQNTAIGYGAGHGITTGTFNTCVGVLCLFNTTSGYQNTAIGTNALLNNTVGIVNTAVGYAAMQNTTSGSYNTGIGQLALFANTTGQFNLAIGNSALAASVGDSFNTAVGYGALTNNNGGSNNTAIGYAAMINNTTGIQNMALGTNALNLCTSGSYNAAIGPAALASLTTGTQNIGIGVSNSAYLTTGSGNVSIGYAAGYATLTTGSDNILLGYYAGYPSMSPSISNSFVAGSDFGIINDVYFGRGSQSPTPSAYTIDGTASSGTNITAGDIAIAGGQGSGTGLGGNILFKTSQAGTTGSALNPLSERMRIDSTGNVGIGTIPSYKLHVLAPDGNPSVLFSGVTKGIRLGFGSTQTNIDGVDSTGVGSYQPLIMGGSFFGFQISGAEKARFDTSGNLGIGTASPNALLDVNSFDFIVESSSTPASSSSACTKGQQQWDANFLYICTATNTFKRVALASF